MHFRKQLLLAALISATATSSWATNGYAPIGVGQENQLTPVQIQQVASYILSLQGTNPPNPKEPQGEKCE